MDDPTKPLPALPAMYVVFSDNGEHIRWWSRSAPSWGEEAGFAAAGATVHVLYSVAGRSPAEVPPNWPDEVQEARNVVIEQGGHALCRELSELESCDFVPLVDALCAAVWRSAQQ